MDDLIKLVDLFQREFNVERALTRPMLGVAAEITLVDTADGAELAKWHFVYDFKDDEARRRFGMLCHAIYTKSHPWEWTITTFVSR